MSIAMLLAHQGGWDEILFVAAPIVLFFGLLFLANRRANQLNRDNRDNQDNHDNSQEHPVADDLEANATDEAS